MGWEANCDCSIFYIGIDAISQSNWAKFYRQIVTSLRSVSGVRGGCICVDCGRVCERIVWEVGEVYV